MEKAREIKSPGEIPLMRKSIEVCEQAGQRMMEVLNLGSPKMRCGQSYTTVISPEAENG